MRGINITLLVDVMLVLLIVFLVQSIPKPNGIELNLSHLGPIQTTTPPPRTVRSLGEERQIQIDGASMHRQLCVANWAH